jgi:hypothetical protein
MEKLLSMLLGSKQAGREACRQAGSLGPETAGRDPIALPHGPRRLRNRARIAMENLAPGSIPFGT